MVYAFIIALLAVVFIFAQEYLNKEEKEESDEERYKSLELV